MKFNKVCVLLRSSMMISTQVACFEHEVPIKQVIFGKSNVRLMTDEEDIANLAGPAGEHNIEEEWERLMLNPKEIQLSENNRMPAPLVAFPRGALDIEDFYTRLRRPRSAPVASTQPPPEKTSTDVTAKPTVMILPPKELRAKTKETLDRMGVEYKGNASTDDLVKLLDEVVADVAAAEDSDAGIQNQG